MWNKKDGNLQFQTQLKEFCRFVSESFFQWNVRIWACGGFFFYNLFSSTANELCQGEASVFHQSAIHTIHRLFYSKHVSNAVKPAHIDH